MEAQNLGNVKRRLAKLFEESLKAIVSGECNPSVAASTRKHGDYQCNNAMALWTKIKGKDSKEGNEFKDAESIGHAIMQNLPQSEIVESCSVARPGFKMLVDGIETWAPQLQMKRVVVDFSSPNIAKEMEDFSGIAIGDLQVLYKEANDRFKRDPEFKESARKAVVKLQSGKSKYRKYRKAWEQICETSRREFQKIYQRLGVELEEKGESFYNQYIPGV
ncbi:putative arginine--tRNA ligase [Rosa chinensis]|uniref:Putative arginine--tRNA ligase n=1 Tax=Rosa chinensis TaxID=74649 RepID=A0A2P6PBJ2_ROSCH|nr:putative arginine--tRNA ligase [Rosa chinensis]